MGQHRLLVYSPESVFCVTFFDPADHWTEPICVRLVGVREGAFSTLVSPLMVKYFVKKNCPLFAGGRLFLLFSFTDEYDDRLRRDICLRSTT